MNINHQQINKPDLTAKENTLPLLEDCYTSEEGPIEWGVNLTENENMNNSERFVNKPASETANGCNNYNVTLLNSEKKGESLKQLKICSWNVAGLRANLRKGLLDYLKQKDTHIIALQETKCPPQKRPTDVLLEGYHASFEDGIKSGYGGIVTLSKAEAINIIRCIGDRKSVV